MNIIPWVLIDRGIIVLKKTNNELGEFDEVVTYRIDGLTLKETGEVFMLFLTPLAFVL